MKNPHYAQNPLKTCNRLVTTVIPTQAQCWCLIIREKPDAASPVSSHALAIEIRTSTRAGRFGSDAVDVGCVLAEDHGATYGYAGTIPGFQTSRLHQRSLGTAASLCVPTFARLVGPNYFHCRDWAALVLGCHEYCFLARARSRVSVFVEAVAIGGRRRGHRYWFVLDCGLLE